VIKSIENYRVARSLTKADMARIFGVPLQNYNNWVYRGSLPKEYFREARRLVGDVEIEREASEIESIIQALPQCLAGRALDILRSIESARERHSDDEILGKLEILSAVLEFQKRPN